MLAELHVRDLGLFEDLTIVLHPGMTALTGETGAGKTLVVEAIEMLLGERADPVLVRAGATEARVEGRFVDATGQELVLARVLPVAGRSRAYIDGRLATLGELTERGEDLVDLHGQHAHQSLLRPAAQRAALDRFAGVDITPLRSAKARLVAADRVLTELGGDARARAREADLLRFELTELMSAQLDDADEDERLAAEEAILTAAVSSREAGGQVLAALQGEGGISDRFAAGISTLRGVSLFEGIEARLRTAGVEIDEAATDLRLAVDAVVEDPERLDTIRGRRRLLSDLCRKYSTTGGTAHRLAMEEVIARRAENQERLAEIERHDERVAEVEAERAAAQAESARQSELLGRARRAAAPALAEAVQSRLQKLALPRARFEVAFEAEADDVAGDSACLLLAANAGQPLLPLSKVASGGELARTMLAARLVLSDAPGTLVFDEVDAGVGGEAALSVGRALAELAENHQVLVVTHLPQVAAFAGHQVAVHKEETAGRTVARVRALEAEDRVVELSRMLSGQPESATARDHAEELLSTASLRRSSP